jgi:hypothetical protein
MSFIIGWVFESVRGSALLPGIDGVGQMYAGDFGC